MIGCAISRMWVRHAGVCGAVFAVLLVTTAASARAAGITGSKHDFSGQGWSTGRICVPCHTPHDANTTIAEGPLWNHTATTAVYTLYSSPTMDVAVGQPGGASKLCLSCHDGTVALDSFGGGTGTTFIASGADVGIDLSDDHPIGIQWDHQTETPPCSTCHDIRNPSDASLIEDYFYGNPGNRKVECPSCHDVHNTSGFDPLLRLTRAGSALCYHCHNK